MKAGRGGKKKEIGKMKSQTFHHLLRLFLLLFLHSVLTDAYSVSSTLYTIPHPDNTTQQSRAPTGTTRFHVSMSDADVNPNSANGSTIIQAYTNIITSNGQQLTGRVRIIVDRPRTTYISTMLMNVATHHYLIEFGSSVEKLTPIRADLPGVFSTNQLSKPNLVDGPLVAGTTQNALDGLQESLFSVGEEEEEDVRKRRGRAGRRSPRPTAASIDQEVQRKRRHKNLMEIHRVEKQYVAMNKRVLRLMQSGSGSGSSSSDFGTSQDTANAFASAASTADTLTAQFLTAFQGNEANASAQVAKNQAFVNNATSTLASIVHQQSQTVRFLNEIQTTNNVTLNAQNQLLSLMQQLNQTTQQAVTVLYDQAAAMDAQLAQLQTSIAATTYTNTQQAQVFQAIVTVRQQIANSLLRSIAGVQEAVNNDLETCRVALQVMENYRLDRDRYRLEAYTYGLVKNQMNSVGLIEFTSRSDPTPIGLGYVPQDTSVSPYFLSFTVVYTFRALITGSSPQAINYPDPDVPNPSTLPVDAQNLYNSLMAAASDPTVDNTFVNLRTYGFECDPDYILENPSNFLTASDIFRMIGPAGCTPRVNCSCWVVVKSERCSTTLAVGWNQSSPVLSSLADVSGVCRDDNELNQWFNPVTNTGSDTSPAQLNALRNVTSASAFFQELSNLCAIQLKGVTQPTQLSNPETNPGIFWTWSSTNQVNLTYLGVQQAIFNNPLYCSPNPIEMATQSIDFGLTLVYDTFLYVRFAAGLLLQASTATNEILKYGGLPVNAMSAFFTPFHYSYDNWTALAEFPLQFEQQLLNNVSNPVSAFALLKQNFQTTATQAAQSGNMTYDAILFEQAKQRIARLSDSESISVLFTGPSSYPVRRLDYVQTTQSIQVQIDIPSIDPNTGQVVYTTVTELDDSHVTFSEVPTNTLPFSWLQVGRLDCIFNLCDNNNPSNPEAAFVISTPLKGAVSTDQLAARCHRIGYAGLRYPELVPDPNNPSGPMIPPFATDDTFIFPDPAPDLDSFLQQENITQFDPTCASVSPGNDYKFLIQYDPVTGVPFCDPAQVAVSNFGGGVMCKLLSNYEIQQPATLFALLDKQQYLVLSPFVWQTSFYVDVPGSNFTLSPNLIAVCPDSSQMYLQANDGSLPTIFIRNTYGIPTFMVMEVQVVNRSLIPSGSDASDPSNFAPVKATLLQPNTFTLTPQQLIAYNSSAVINTSSSSPEVICSQVYLQAFSGRAATQFSLPSLAQCQTAAAPGTIPTALSWTDPNVVLKIQVHMAQITSTVLIQQSINSTAMLGTLSPSKKISMYQNIMSLSSSALLSPFQLCWTTQVNFASLYNSSRSLFYTGDVVLLNGTLVSRLANTTFPPTLNTQPLSSLDTSQANFVTSQVANMGMTSLDSSDTTNLYALVMLNDTNTQITNMLLYLLSHTNYTQDDIQPTLNQMQQVILNIQANQQLAGRILSYPVGMNSLPNGSTAASLQLLQTDQSALSQQLQTNLQNQGAEAAQVSLVNNQIEQLSIRFNTVFNITVLTERLLQLNLSAQNISAQAELLIRAANYSFGSNSTLLQQVIIEAASHFSNASYQKAAAFTVDFGDAGTEFVDLAKKAGNLIETGINIVQYLAQDIANFVKPNPSCPFGINGFCEVKSILIDLAIGAGAVGGGILLIVVLVKYVPKKNVKPSKKPEPKSKSSSSSKSNLRIKKNNSKKTRAASSSNLDA